MSNRHERRVQEAKLRKAGKEMQRPDYRPADDPQVREGIATMARAMTFSSTTVSIPTAAASMWQRCRTMSVVND
jgi:hypothetical protein